MKKINILLLIAMLLFVIFISGACVEHLEKNIDTAQSSYIEQVESIIKPVQESESEGKSIISSITIEEQIKSEHVEKITKRKKKKEKAEPVLETQSSITESSVAEPEENEPLITSSEITEISIKSETIESSVISSIIESSVVETSKTLEEKKAYWESINPPPPTGKHLTKRGGVFQGPSGKETYYNLKMNGILKNVVYGTKWKGSLGLDPDEYPYWVRSDGVKMVGPYIMCAAALDARPYGTILDTSLGKAIVVDTGTFAKKNKTQVDIAVNW